MASRSSAPGFSVCKKLEEHTAAVTHLLSVGGQMWSGCADGNIRIWEIEVKSRGEFERLTVVDGADVGRQETSLWNDIRSIAGERQGV